MRRSPRSIRYTRLMCFRKVRRGLFCALRFLRNLANVTLTRLYLSQRRLRESDEYVSTWEHKDENKTDRTNVFHEWSRGKNMYAARDMENFRRSCQDLDGNDISDDNDADEKDKGHFCNLAFHHGQIKSSPDDVHIDEFHQQWWGKYERLENVHSYIQWLFPIQEPGVNCKAHVLTKKEIKLFRKDKQAKSKLVKSYKLMLDFYGIRLVDESTGEVERAPNWKNRFRNLNRHTHNNLRITRILKCLGTLGLKHYQAPLVKFFLHETLVEGHLSNVKQSVLDYFMFAVLDKSERRELVKFALEQFKPQKHFVSGPEENVAQPIENKQRSTVEDNLKRLNKYEAVILNKPTVSNSDQGANENSQCMSENNNITPANMSHGDNNESGPHQTEVSLCQMHDLSGVSDNDSGLQQFKEEASCLMSDITML
ncbi:opioid growth factor receptor isoform X1 [Carassius gibelio]|uniref:opioid growth factor receptor isoform X1 n=1 Tax=Carassius gibelio TaxID=101364 RepID=UPI0022781A4C|nr:opioid growth factor receptor isoform X1 [Carassius gibelio]XP_052464971.1 opioid growth factor receptor isoform X1 [Carassius gibelio]